MNQDQNKDGDARAQTDGRNKRKKKMGNRAGFMYAAALFLIFSVLGIAGVFLFKGRSRMQVSAISEGAGRTAETAEGIEAAEGDAFLDNQEESRDYPVEIQACEILSGGGQFTVSGVVKELPESDDHNFYLFELETYEDAIGENKKYIAWSGMKENFQLSAKLYENTEKSRLYSKFVVAVKKDGEYEIVSSPRYITNPEALADYSEPFPEAESIKGLLVDPQKLGTSELDDLGVKHAGYNIPVSRLLGPSTDKRYPTITYTYNGKDYIFNGHVVSEYDYVFRTLTEKGIIITAILLNNKSDAYPQLIHPLSRGGSAYYYAFNAAEKEGTDYLEAIAAFLAERYRDNTHGIVMNWIIGNEVNVRSTWNYMKYIDIVPYAREYAQAVRLFYNGIKSHNANAKIYISLDQQWNRNLSSNSSYDSKDLLDVFNECVKAEGNFDWGLAHHPYSVPMTWPKFWDLSGEAGELVLETEDTSMVTIYNIDVITSYLQKQEFLMPDGEVRPVLLSEMGFTSTYGEDVQAAAFAYAYYIAENNQYIDAMILSRETDAAEEVAQGLALGLSYQNGRRKYIYDTFKYIDTGEADAYTEFARNYLGIQSWDQVITKR